MNRLKRFALSAIMSGLMATAQAAEQYDLQVVAQSDTAVWNAVAVDNSGALYVSGPRWMGSQGPSVSKLDGKGQPHPFPDARWNSEDPKIPAQQRFINVNAMRVDDKQRLWIVDAGVTDFGGKVVPGGAKLVVVDLDSGLVEKVIPFESSIAQAGSYIDDVRLNGGHAYLTDAGVPGIIVLDLATQKARRVLSSSQAVRAPEDRDIIVGGKVLRAPDGRALRVHADPLEVSNDGKWLYFAPLTGPWYKIETRWLDDPSVAEEALAQKVEYWKDLPPVGGTVMDKSGNFYFSDLAQDSVKRIAPDGEVRTLATDKRLHWVDAPAFDRQGRLYLPAAQVDRVSLFNNGASQVQRPLEIYRLNLE
ncbi:L-dopachrome tautomerase-related protein [Pseudomonas sp. DTU_2021_1001937_2_SI_NGA_ILE_001]|uniref:L-dopachrome tautomerase-related protein n=1 Tax=Pseudomonas sp. DTU_2021_1001937_2_SI_NGA_ILE_001 TaxID=3077589 RepID=UPI0028FC244D|nr:L-dopachrome tautomerase-related protein [Pseudomonas sp. DTU_2021_1001937_2_SI_NGA_ILE_001]WNW12763.1 L-dopachrome tautomerase-related protein [Pseudomonas sp. DTU_2021_1001937_2_SI_NGA_ILE_001]